MTNIDDLPAIDIWPLIFKNLSINDLFSCRLVNKKFKNFSDHSDGIYRLIVGEYVQQHWNLNKKPAKKEESITLKCYQQIRSLNLFNLNKNLKYLIIRVYNDNEFNLEELSSFVNLENLEIEIYKFNKDQNLNLKNLKFLDFKTWKSKNKINLNTPKLTMIKYDNFTIYVDHFEEVRILNLIFCINPESIKHFIIDRYFNELKIFKNLEILELFSLDRIDSDFLNDFTKLRKIKFKDCYNNIDKAKNLLNYVKNLQRDIRIYFKDVKIENVSTINEYEHFKKNDLVYQIKNYNQLDSNLSTITYDLNYNQLEHSFGDLQINLPASFFDKFVDLYEIHVNDNVNNVDNLNWFLKNLKNLRELYLYDKSLDQNFYDNLPNTIRKLYIDSNKNIENYDFMLKLTKLTNFSTSRDLSDAFDLALKSFLNLNEYLEQFGFRISNKHVLITKFRGKFYLSVSNIEKKKMNYKKLVNFIDIIRLDGIINII